jgi:hypothetical protein
VSPATPVWLIWPAGTARPWACAAASRSASSAPPPARARFACGSTLTWLSWLRSITGPLIVVRRTSTDPCTICVTTFP